MNYLQNIFQLAHGSNQSKERLKKAVEEQCEYIASTVRPALTPAQNEALSVALEELITVVSDCSYIVGYNGALQTFAEGRAMLEPPTFPQQ